MQLGYLPIEVHRRQWIITRSATVPSKLVHFATQQLGGGKAYLHRHPLLNAASVGSSLVLGTIVPTARYGDQLYRETGSFVVIDWPWLTTDAFASMGVFYFPGPKDIVCSSSVALISDAKDLPIAGRKLDWSQRMNWDPVPTSRISGLRKMFCDQALNLVTGTTEHRNRSVSIKQSETHAAAGLAEHFANVVRRTREQYDRILLPLTAGKDSRTIFSALMATGTPFEAFTYLVAGERSRIDARVASDLCKRFGVSHFRIAAENAIGDADKFARHTGGSEGDAGQTLARGNFYRYFRLGDVILSGGGFEVARRFYEDDFRSVPLEASKVAAKKIAEQFKESDPRVIGGLRTWFQYRRAHPVESMDYIDEFYLDQRLGGWLSANRQGRDAYLPSSLTPAISWNCMEYLMSTTPERRAAGTIQMQAMERLVPGITTLAPFNPEPLKTRLIRSARGVGRRLLKGFGIEAPVRFLLGK